MLRTTTTRPHCTSCASHARWRPTLSTRVGAAKKATDNRTASAPTKAAAAQETQKKKKKKWASNKDLHAPEYQASALTLAVTAYIRDSQSLLELGTVISEWGSSFDSIHAAAAFTKAAWLARNMPAAARPLLPTLTRVWEEVLPSATIQGLSNVLWACGRLEWKDNQLWSSTVEAFMEQHLKKTTCQNYANILHGMSLIADANKGNVPGMPREIVVEVVREMLASVRVLVTNPMEDVKPIELASILRACSVLVIAPSDAEIASLLHATARPSVLEMATAQSLSNTLMAVSEPCMLQHLGQVKQRVWEALVNHDQLKRISQGIPMDASSTILAVARLSRGQAAPISKQLAQRCAAQLLATASMQEWDSKAVGSVIMACMQLELADRHLLQQVAEAAPHWLPAADAAAIDLVASACAEVQYGDLQLMRGLIKRTRQLLQANSKGKGQVLTGIDEIRLPAVVGWAVATVDLQQLAGDVVALIGSSGVLKQQDRKLNTACAEWLWVVHTWLLQQQLLDCQGLAGLLTQEQLAVCQEAAAASPTGGGVIYHGLFAVLHVAWSSVQPPR